MCCTAFVDYKQTQTNQNGNNNRKRRPGITRLDHIDSRNKGSGNVIPGIGSCGITGLAHRIFGGDETQLDDYPWMVILEYQNRKLLLKSYKFRTQFLLFSLSYPIHCFTSLHNLPNI